MRATTVLILSILFCNPAAAQQFDRRALFAELLNASDSALTAAADRWTRELPGSRDLISGLVAFRRYELTGNQKEAERAEELLDRARNAADHDPWAHYAYALALAHGPEVQSNGAVLRASGRSWASQLGLDARAKAHRAVERALELDSLHEGAAVILGEIALQTHNAEHTESAARALQRVARETRSAEVFRTLARMLEETGQDDAALAASERAVSLSSDPVTRYAHALTLLRNPGRESAGAQQYFAAFDGIPGALADRLFEEIRPIATAADTLRWHNTAPSDRREYFEKFWRLRAALASVPVHERLAEHYRRLFVALAKYPRLMSGPQSPTSVTWGYRTHPVDARGQIYIRQGKPFKTVYTPHVISGSSCVDLTNYPGRARLGETEARRAERTLQLPDHGLQRMVPSAQAPYRGPPGEIWLYRNEAGRLRTYVFVQCPGGPDWQIPYDLPCYLDLPPEVEMLEFDIRFCGTSTSERLREWAREALTTDRHRPPLDRAVPYNFDLLSFRGADRKTDLLAPIGVLIDTLRYETVPGGHRYRLRITAAVVDTALQRVEQSDTVATLIAAQPLQRGNLLNLHTMISVLPTKHAFLRLLVQNAAFRSDGSLTAQEIRVPSYAGDSLMISDLVLGAPVEGGNFSRGGRRISVMPIARFVNGSFRVFYEVYNLPRGPYRTELLVEPLDAPGAREVRLSFNEEAIPDADGVVRVLRSVDTQLPSGRYRLWVRINSGGRTSLEKVRVFFVGR